MNFVKLVKVTRRIMRRASEGSRVIRSGSRCGMLALALAAGGASAGSLLPSSTGAQAAQGATMGVRFTSAYATTVINYLGVFDSDGDGLLISHKVGLYLWDGAAYTLQGSVTVPAGANAPLYNGYRWVQLANPITLSNLGATMYLVAADNTGGSGDTWGYIDPSIADGAIGTLPATEATLWTGSPTLPAPSFSIQWWGPACNNANIATDIPSIDLDGRLLPASTGSQAAQGASMGVRFTSASADKVINSLGVFDSDGDGLNISHQVGLYELIGGVYTLQGRVTVQAGTAAPLFAGYRWAQLSTPITLSNLEANQYLVAADNADASGDNWGYVDPSIANRAIGTLPVEFATLWVGRSTLPGPSFSLPGEYTWSGPACNNANIATAISPRVLTWDNGASTMNWDTAGANWTGLTWNNGNPDQAVFGAAGAGTLNLTEPITAGSLTFDSAGYTLAGSTLTLTGYIAANADAAIFSTIVSGALTKGGTGKLTLTAANTYGGDTRIHKGTLSVTGSAKLYTNQGYTGGLVYIYPGATLELDGWGGGLGSLGQIGYSKDCVVIDGGTLRYVGTSNSHEPDGNGPGFTIGGNGACLDCASAGQTWFINYDSRGDYYMQSNGGTLTLTGAGNGQIDKIIPGSGGLTKSGSGTWTLGGANTYGGATGISEGTLAVSGSGCLGGGVYAGAITNNGALSYSSSAAQKLSGVISGTGAVTQAGSGTLTFGGANTYSGATVVESGTLQLTQAQGLSADTAVVLAPGAVLNLDFTGTDTVRSMKVGARQLSRGVLYDATRLPGVITGSGSVKALEGPPAGTLVLVF